MTDVVTTLRARAQAAREAEWDGDAQDCDRAADTIEALRSALRRAPRIVAGDSPSVFYREYRSWLIECSGHALEEGT